MRDRDGGFFYGQLHLQSDMDGQAYLRLFGDRSGDFEGKIPASPGWFRYNTWNAMQLVIQEMILNGPRRSRAMTCWRRPTCS